MNYPQVPQSMRRSSRIASSLSSIRKRHRTGLYSIVGALGALAGLILARLAVLIAQLALRVRGTPIVSDSFTSASLTGLHFGIFTSALGASMFLGIHWYQRHEIPKLRLLTVALFGFLIGGTSGGLVQILFNGVTDLPGPAAQVVVMATWVLIGTILGTALSNSIPNLTSIRGMTAGLIAGLFATFCVAAAAGTSTAATDSVLSIGYIILGASLGFAMAIVERYFREALIEVQWAPRETTLVGLGAKPVTIGGGRDHIFILGAPAQVSSIAIKSGQIEHVETANGKRTLLKDGSRLRIGGLTMVIHAAPAPAATMNRQATHD